MGIFKKTLALGATMALTGSLQAAPVPDQQSEVYGDWTVRCTQRENVPPCDMVQVATRGEAGEQVLRVSIAYAGNGDNYGVQIVVPLGVLISGGVLIRADGEEIQTDLQFTRCEASGCFIEAIMDSKALEPFRLGDEGIIAILDPRGEPMVMPLSFSGFIAAMETMTQRNSAWAADKEEE